MNAKSLLAVFVLAILALGFFFFPKGSEPEDSGGMQNGVTEEVSGDGETQEAALVGDGSAKAATEAGRQTVPQRKPEAVPEADSEKTAPSNGVFARVADSQGNGLEGVEVLVRSLNLEAGFDIRGWDSSSVVKVKSGKDGRVAFDVSADPFLVKIAGTGFVSREMDFQGGTEAGEDLGTWTLDRALVLTGQVVGPNGNPVSGARIIAPQDGGFVMVIDGNVDSIAETDAAGRFTIDTMKPGSWRLLVNSEGYPDQIFSGEASAELQQNGLLWTLNEGASLRGRVVGRPASNSDVLAVRMDLAPMVSRDSLLGGAVDGFPNLSRSVDLQADGTFAVHGLHPETKHRIRLVPKGNNGGILFSEGRSRCDEQTISSSVGTVDLVWSTKASLRVLVLDAETSSPVENYSLAPNDFEFFHSLSGVDEHPPGLMEVSGVPPSSKPLAINIWADGYETFTVESVKFNAGGLTDLGTIRLSPGVLCQIHVVEGATGKSVNGARIELTSIEESNEDDSHTIGGVTLGSMGREPMKQSGKTDKEGLVSLRYMKGAAGKIKARHARYARAEVSGVDMTAFRDEPLRVELWKGGELSVTVLDENDEPVRGVKVDLSDTGQVESQMTFTFGAGSSGSGGDTNNLSKTTNSKGVARFKHVPAGDYRCNVAWPGSNSGMGVVMIVDSGDENESEEPTGKLVTIKEGGTGVLTMAAPLRSTLEGIILENGTPLVGARVSVAQAGGPRMFTSMMGGGDDGGRTDRDGRFLLENLDPGKVVVTVKHDLRVMDYTEEITLDGGANEFSAKLEVATISGRVVDAAGSPLEGIRISAEEFSEGGQTQRVMTSVVMISSDDSEGGGMEMTSAIGNGRKPTITDSEGRFELRGVLPGKPLKVVAEGQNLTTARSKVMTVPDGSLRSGVVMTMVPGCELTVRVVDQQGDPIQHALVGIDAIVEEGEEEGTGGAGPRGTTNSDGIATFDTLKPGTYNVSAFRLMQGAPEDQTFTPITVEALNPKEMEITID
ncbi:MAG: carboxypeptidase regulatory-like domain-containing protein [bacterium]|nr:carboxypeptidase regulatory-like domain-containing protein [bacterium]